MKSRFLPNTAFPFFIKTACLFSSYPLIADTITWNNSSADGLWSTPANWDTASRPDSVDDVVFPAGLGGSVTFDVVPILPSGFYTPTAQSIQFDDNYTLGGIFTGLSPVVSVGAGLTVNWNANSTLGAELVKSGAGTLVANGLLTGSGVIVNGGVFRANADGASGGGGDFITINSGGTYEFNNFHHDFPILLNDGGSLIGLGSASTNFSTNSLVISGAATAVSIGAAGPADVLRTDWLSGGSTSTVITKNGSGTLRLNSANALQGSWLIPTGTVQIVGTLENLGTNPAASVTLSGGTLAVELSASNADYTDGPGNNILVTADSGFLNDRPGLGTGRSATFGTLTMGSQTLNVAAGANVTSGDAGFTFENLTLTGDPVFSITQANTGPGHFQALTLNGGGVPRTITKTGPGNISFHASGTNELATGSTITATGGGTMLLNFPAISLGAVSEVPMAQNPIGNADLSITDGTLSLRGSSTGTIFSLPNDLTLGGDITVDPERNVSGSGNVVFRMSSITLKPGTVMSVSGDNSFAIGSLGPVVLEGNATVQGFNSGTTADGVTNFYGGISGGPGSALTIGNTVRPINLTISASSTYGGGTLMQGGNVTLGAANAFGTGTTTLSGGTLVLNADEALNGTVTLNGGTLVVNGANVLANNPVVMNGGTLDLRTNVTTGAAIPSLTVSGTTALNTTRVSSSGSAVLTVPVIDVAGNTTLTVTAASNVSSLLSGFDLAGDLTLNASSASRILSITEDGSPRKLIKSGTAQLDLEGASNHSGGTEVLSGILYVQDGAGLGSGTLTIGDTSGTAAATARFAEGFTIPNNIVVRSGSSGLMTIDAETGVVTWNGSVELQKSVTLDNGSATAADFSTFNGIVSGAGDITKIGGGEIILANASNSFGSGSATSVSVSAGNLTVASNGALGNVANGVNLTSSGILKITGSFSTGRTITVTGTAADVNVTSGNTLTLSAPIAGTGTFAKGDAGTLEFAPSVDGSARGASVNQLNAGTLRLQGALNLGNASPLTLSGGTLQLLNDSNTNFAHPVTLAAATATIHVDRAAGGSATNGRHTLGTLSATTGNLTVTGDNGFGLTLGDYTTTSNSSLANNAPGTLILPSITGNPGTSSRTLTVRGSGDIQVNDAISEGAGTGSYGLVKEGSGRFTFGSSVADFNRILAVEDGTVDLNGLSHSLTGLLTLGGSASALGARIETDGGTLTLGAGMTFSNSSNPAGAVITGNVGLAAVSHPFTINNSSTAAADVTIDGPITGDPGSSITKSGAGTLVFSGAGNNLPGLVTVSGGVLELAKSSGDGIGTGGLATSSTGIVRLAAADQISNNAALSIGAADESFLELSNFTETVGPLTITQSDANDYSGVKTGTTGTLVLNGNLTFNNNANSTFTDGREVLITGSGSEFAPATDGTLDLGGATRTIHVTTTTVGTNEPKANATIETQIINGGILKTGPRTLILANPNNTFAGGLQIAGGTVKSVGGTSLGLGPVTFTNAAGVAAGLDFGTSTGPIADNFTLNGLGDVTFTYSGLAPNTLTLSGDFSTTQNLIFDVVNGSTSDGDTATIDHTGTIDDAAATINLTKVGNGTLKLAPGNTFGGSTTVRKGILSIAAESALGDGSEALVIDGGCLAPSASITLGRNLVFGADGGSVRGGNGQALDLPAVEWGAGASAFFGSGTTILSGTTTGSGGDLTLGLPTSFASAPGNLLVGSGHVLSLRGTSSLPAGNLGFDNRAVLELGNGNFTRALGTGPGEVQLPTATGGGWAAHGADRSVNLGGAGATVIWGQTSPAFLYKNVPGDDYGDLLLGSATATHTIDFQNPIDLNNGTTNVSRDVIVSDGAAAIDARISGGISQTADPNLTFTSLDLEVQGALEISGPISGEIHLDKLGTGTVILSGTNTYFGDLAVYEGTLDLAGDASWGAPQSVFIDTGATLDASALTSPITISANESISIYGTLLGDVSSPDYIEGNGLVVGNIHAQAGAYLFPDYGGTFHITGDLTLDATAFLDFFIQSTVPQTGHNQLRVGGIVNLSGDLTLGGDASLALNDSAVLILNDGSDPIVGTFTGLPEGAAVPIGNGLALQVTYLANGDGGAIGNDFGVTVVEDTFSSDLSVAANAPAAVAPAAGFTIDFTVSNSGPASVADGFLNILKPANVGFAPPYPAGATFPAPDEMSIALTNPLSPGDSVFQVHFTAPAATTAVSIDSTLSAGSPDSDPGNNSYRSTIAVLPGAAPMISVLQSDPVNQNVTIEIDTINGINYVFEHSIDLIDWDEIITFTGNGAPYQRVEDFDETKEFFRFGIAPQGGHIGGSEE